MIINCKSNEFDDIKTTYESFGYEFVSSEIIATVSNDNFDEKSSGDLTLASRSEQTLSVTFKREKNIPNYEFLVALEKRYNNLTKEYDNLKYKHAAAFSWFIILGVLIFILFLSITIIIGQEGGPFGATMVFIPFGVALMVIGIVLVHKKSSFNNEVDNKKESITIEKSKIISQARQYQGKL